MPQEHVNRSSNVLNEISKAAEAVAKYVTQNSHDAASVTAAAAFFSSPCVAAALVADVRYFPPQK